MPKQAVKRKLVAVLGADIADGGLEPRDEQ